MVNSEIDVIGKQEKNDFPKLMIDLHAGIIVLMKEPKIGVCLKGVDATLIKTGHYSENWIMDRFEDFANKIILQNKGEL